MSIKPNSSSGGRVVVVGSSNTDFVVEVDSLPAPGETRLGGSFFTASGGKGANQAVAAARAGAVVTLVARLGNDDLGRKSLEAFEAEGIDTSRICTDSEAASGVAFVLLDAAGENSIVVASGANSLLDEKQVQSAVEAFRRADVCLIQLETPLPSVASAIQLASEVGIPAILNPAPAQPLSDEHTQGLFLITPNETETEILTGIRPDTEADARQAADALQKQGVANVIITLGARGSLLAQGNDLITIPALRVSAVDTTAAGDAFNGALAAALSRGRSLVDSACFASCAGALAVTRRGAQPSLPHHEDILRELDRLKEP